MAPPLASNWQPCHQASLRLADVVFDQDRRPTDRIWIVTTPAPKTSPSRHASAPTRAYAPRVSGPVKSDRDQRKERYMKKLLAVLLVFGTASTAFGFDRHEDGVHWRGIADVIAVQGGNNPIGDPEHAHVD